MNQPTQPQACGEQSLSPAEVMLDFAQVGAAGPFPVVNGRVAVPDVTMHDLAHMLKPTTDAPAAKAAPTDEEIEDFLASRTTPEGRVPFIKTIREALAIWAMAPLPAAAEPAYADSTPHLSVGDSSFESWWSNYLLHAPVHQGAKQKARDAYAAGMGDPLVTAAPVEQPAAAAEVLNALDRMDALLDPACGLLTVPEHSATVQASRDDMAIIRAAITTASARAAVSAPSAEAAYEMGAKGGKAPEAERLAFEAWMRGHCWALSATWRGTQYMSDREEGGDLDPRAMMTRRMWAVWRDRAALAAAPQAPAQEVARG